MLTNANNLCLGFIVWILIVFSSMNSQTIYPIEDFNDGNRLNLFGGNWGELKAPIVKLENLPNQTQYNGESGGILRISYHDLPADNFTGLWMSYWNVADDSYAGLSFSHFDSISFYIKGSGNPNKVHQIKFELRDKKADPGIFTDFIAFRRFSFPDSITRWKRFTFDTEVQNVITGWRFTGVSAPDTSNMKYLAVVLEGNRNDSDGTFFIDQIEFSSNSPSQPPSTTAEQLRGIEKKSARYFLDWFCDKNGLFYHRLPAAELYSPIATGYGLMAIALSVKNCWISVSKGRQMSNRILDALLDRVVSQEVPDSTGYGGFLYQFLNLSGTRQDSITSVMLADHAILIAGALVNGQYFGDEIKEKANALWAAANWKLFLSSKKPRKGTLYIAWNPEPDTNFAVTESGREGYFSGINDDSPLTLDYYSDEKILISILAAGSPNPEHRLDQSILFSWNRVKSSGGEFIQSWNGSLDDCLLSNLFLDYNKLGYDRHIKSEWQINWLRNARNFARNNLLFNAASQTLSSNSWGITSCETFVPGNPDSIIYQTYGVEPKGNPDKQTIFDGTIAPHAATSAIVLGEDIESSSIEAFQNYTNNSYLNSPLYGLYESYNLDSSNEFLDGWYNRSFVSFHTGQTMVAIENYLSKLETSESGFIQKLFMETTETILKQLFYNADTIPFIPKSFQVLDAYPNPFNGEVHLSYELPYSLPVKIRVINTLGQQLQDLTEISFKQAGLNTWKWTPGKNIASGVYYWTIEYNGEIKSRKLLYIR